MSFAPVDSPLVITVAPTGGDVTRTENPNLPHTPEEIAAEVERSFEAGAAVCHLHVREADGTPSARLELWLETVERVRKACPGMVVMVSTGGSIGMTEEERLAGLAARPDMASLTTGTTNFGDDVFFNPLPMARRFANRMVRDHIRPELEVFDVGMIAAAERLVKEGVLLSPLHFNLVLGVPGALPGTPEHLLHMLRTLPDGSSWCASGIGRCQRQVVGLAIVLGGHLRVGFEDNVKLSRTELARSNAEFVAQAAAMARAYGRPLASPEEARVLLGLAAAAARPSEDMKAADRGAEASHA